MLVFAADLHLSPNTWAALPELCGDSYSSLRQIVDYCLKKKADALILGGDVFDRRNPDSASVAVFMDQMRKLRAASIPIFAIQGQHDRSDPPWTQIHGDLGIIQLGPQPFVGVPVGNKTYNIAGFDNTSAANVQETLKTIEGADIVVLHQSLKGVMGFADKWDLDEAWLHDNVKLGLVGDIHLPVSSGRCYYPGSTHMCAIDEPIEKSFITVDAKLAVKRVKMDTREVVDLMVETEDGLTAAIATIRHYKPKSKRYPRSIIYVRLAPDVPGAYDALKTACAEAEHFFMPATLKVSAEGEATQERSVAATSLESCLAQAVDPTEAADAYGFILRLLKAEKPADELIDIKKEMGV